jgi:hypothetical protein
MYVGYVYACMGVRHKWTNSLINDMWMFKEYSCWVVMFWGWCLGILARLLGRENAFLEQLLLF